MARTIIGVNDAKAVKRYAGLLAYDESQKSYFNQRFIGRGAESETPIQLLTDLESDAGEMISYDLLAELKMAPIEGENNLENNEEAQKFFTDTIYIDQARCGVNTGGRMTRKRTLHNLREKAKRQQAGWWARLFDELLFIYLSGARGINTNFLLPTGYTGRANNSLYAPDTNHILYGGNATSKASMTNEAAGRGSVWRRSMVRRRYNQSTGFGYSRHSRRPGAAARDRAANVRRCGVATLDRGIA